MPHITSIAKLGTCHGHQDSIYTVAGAAQQRQFHTAGADGMVVLWDADRPDTGEVVAKVNGTVYALCHLPDGNRMVVGQNAEGIHLIDLATRSPLRSLKLTGAAIFDIQAHDGTLYIACGDGTVVLVDIDRWETVWRFRATEQAARSIAICPANGEFAVGYSDHRVRIFGLRDGRALRTLDRATGSVFALTYSPDGHLLFAAGRDAHLRTYEVTGGHRLRDELIPHMYTVNHMVFNPDRQTFATCSKDKSVRIWDAASMLPLRTIDRGSHAGHGTSVNRLLWLDSETLVSVSDDRTASIWRICFDRMSA